MQGGIIDHDFRSGLGGWELIDPNGRVEEWLGRPALRLESGPAFLDREIELAEFAIEAELGAPGAAYAGVVFNAGSADNYQLVYAQPHSSGQPDAIQYELVCNGSNTWQIYHGPSYQAPAEIPTGAWFAFRVEVREDRAAVTVSNRPALVSRLVRHGRRPGRVGLWSYLPAYCSRFAVQPLDPGAGAGFPEPATVGPPDGCVPAWLVGLGDNQGKPPARRDWQRAQTEENGVLNVNRLFTIPPMSSVPLPEPKVAYARATVHSPEATQTTVSVGFSDRLRIWVNDGPVHQGEHRWHASGSPDGRIRADFASRRVPLVKGANEVLAELAVDEPFGWGLIVSFEAPVPLTFGVE